MRIFVYPGTLDGANLGDVAMLQVSRERLLTLWPDAVFSVLTRDPVACRNYFQDANPVLMSGCKHWLKETSSSWTEVLLPNRRRLAREFAESFLRADFVVMSGAGILNDSFQGPEARALRVLEAALERGLPTALLGQGIGPIENEPLRARAAAVLPRVDAIFVREPLASVSLLHALGVAPEQIVVTGDDAVELAYHTRCAEAGRCVGVNLRHADYAGLGREAIDSVHTLVTKKAREFDAKLVGIPITRGHRDSDVATLRRLLKLDFALEPGEDWAPSVAIRRLSRCRVVVAGSYHAGVFALSQGIPLVGVVKSAYYEAKFAGLAAQFGAGCEVLRADEPEFAQRFSASLTRAWEGSEALRPKLLLAAERQIAAGRTAYARLKELAGTGPKPKLVVK